MLGTDDVYRNVIGMNPDVDKHLIFADIEPVWEFEKKILYFCKFSTISINFLLLIFVCRTQDIQ